MRKYLTTLLLSLLTATVFSQPPTENITRTAADYTKKSKHQKTTGWVLTTAGTTGLLVTLLADMTQTVGGAFVTVVSLGTAEPDYKSYTPYYLLSTAAIASGVTYFIKAGKNKKKANALQTGLKLESAPVLQTHGVGQQTYPSLSLSLPL